MRSIVNGVILIAIGLVRGSSVFLGNADMLDWIFDGLGVGLIVYGITQMRSQQS